MLHRVSLVWAVWALACGSLGAAEPSDAELVQKSKRIVFLGDSITFAGGYVAIFDAWLAAKQPNIAHEVISCGLPSETVSGLSEDGHAGGKFPRPDLAERLERVLQLTKPDLVVACYGMNCGIYQPLAEERFAKYRAGIEGLRKAAAAVGAEVIHVTPPFHDNLRSPKQEFVYNDVLGAYAKWLISQREKGWRVIDLHGPMTAEVLKRRQTDAKFTLQPDGVHPNGEGQWVVARTLIAALGGADEAAATTPEELLARLKAPKELLSLTDKRMQLLRNAYVAKAGHKRPGVASGLPLEEAQAKAAELTQQIEKLLAKP